MPKKDPGSVLEQSLIAEFRDRIPRGEAIARTAVANALKGSHAEPDWIKEHFSSLVSDVQKEAMTAYFAAEVAAGKRAIKKAFEPLVAKAATAQDALTIISEKYRDIDRFLLSVTQGRKPRAGSAFELLIRELFTRLKYPFTAQAVINGQPDFVLPSVDYYRKYAIDSIIFTVKRTLRERWKQITTEGTQALGFFLATIDEDVAQKDLSEMLRFKIHLVVPTELKAGVPLYKVTPNVLSFETFFAEHLDPAMARWKSRKVIS